MNTLTTMSEPRERNERSVEITHKSLTEMTKKQKNNIQRTIKKQIPCTGLWKRKIAMLMALKSVTCDKKMVL